MQFEQISKIKGQQGPWVQVQFLSGEVMWLAIEGLADAALQRAVRGSTDTYNGSCNQAAKDEVNTLLLKYSMNCDPAAQHHVLTLDGADAGTCRVLMRHYDVSHMHVPNDTCPVALAKRRIHAYPYLLREMLELNIPNTFAVVNCDYMCTWQGNWTTSPKQDIALLFTKLNLASSFVLGLTFSRHDRFKQHEPIADAMAFVLDTSTQHAFTATLRYSTTYGQMASLIFTVERSMSLADVSLALASASSASATSAASAASATSASAASDSEAAIDMPCPIKSCNFRTLMSPTEWKDHLLIWHPLTYKRLQMYRSMM